MNRAIIKIVFYRPGNYTPQSIEYTISPETHARMKGDYDRFWKCPGHGWCALSQTPTFRRLFAPVLRKLHAQNVTAYIKPDNQ